MSTGQTDVRNPADLLRRSARGRPDGPALVDGDRRWTWGELDAAVDRAALRLGERVPEAGARVALLLPTCAEFVVVYLAAVRAGLVAVPIDPSYTRAEIEHITGDAAVSLLVDPDVAGDLVSGVVGATGEPGDGAAGAVRGDEDVVAILYTSGTSGKGKGAMLSARALLANVAQVAGVRPPLVAAGDVVFLPVPLSHILGLNAGLGAVLHAGATLVLAGATGFDPAATLATMASERVTTVLAVPGQYAAWVAQPGFADGFARVRFAMSGSTRLGRGLVDRYAQAGVALREGYGLTETAPVVALSTPADPAHEAAGTVGRPVPGLEVELRDTDDEVVDDGDPGRLVVRGDSVFSGYWPDGRDGPAADGWFATGDLAVADAAGRLRIVGRVTDLVLVNGFNVYPAEVETVLSRAEGVAEAAVVGVRDQRTGEAVHAYVVPVDGVALDPADLTAHAASALARFKVPTAIHVVEALPHTVTGKVKKWQLDDTTGGDRDGAA